MERIAALNFLSAAESHRKDAVTGKGNKGGESWVEF